MFAALWAVPADILPGPPFQALSLLPSFYSCNAHLMLPPAPFKAALLSTRSKHTTSDLSLVFMIYIAVDIEMVGEKRERLNERRGPSLAHMRLLLGSISRKVEVTFMTLMNVCICLLSHNFEV